MITAVTNSRIKRIVQLNQKTKVRKEEDCFVVEGTKMFLEAPDAKIREVFVTQEYHAKCDTQVLAKLQRCSCELVSGEVFAKISDTQTPQGILCVVEQLHYTIEDILQKESPLVVLLEDLQDPGNLGTIIRTGEGAGIGGVLMSKDTVDIYNPKTIRATMGSIYRVPFLYVEELSGIIQQLQKKQIQVYAAHLEGDNYYNSYNYKQGTAFLIGNEGNGLKKETADLADAYLKIPMEGQVESLNAGVATALLLYEARRQRMQ
ncbi:MAG: RNA methyltransferase [Lachnospiraceae bacterium]